MPMFSRFKRAKTVDDVMAEIPWSGAVMRRQRHRSVWTSVTSLTSLDVDEILAACSDCWFFEEKVEVCKLQLEDVSMSEESLQEPKTVVAGKTPSSPEKNSNVTQAEVHVDAPSKVELSSPLNESFYQSLHKYHDPKSWEKEDDGYAYSSDEEEEPANTDVALAEIHHTYDSDVVDADFIAKLDAYESWCRQTDVPIEEIERRRRLMKNGCVYWDPLEITFERSETITLPDLDQEESAQKTKKPGAWKKFKRGLGKAGRRLQKLFCGCLMEEEFDDADLYILEFKSRGIDVVVV
ncbi:hypothetical protein Bbelb_135640 [Branchiostoma belcheri]|nr:hypothetical protein Bbelb_135640 [Branchiostoma belcheri]